MCVYDATILLNVIETKVKKNNKFTRKEIGMKGKK